MNSVWWIDGSKRDTMYNCIRNNYVGKEAGKYNGKMVVERVDWMEDKCM